MKQKRVKLRQLAERRPPKSVRLSKKGPSNKKVSILVGSAVIFGVFLATYFYFQEKSRLKAPAVLVPGHSPVIGPTNASVTVVEFLDPECEPCRSAHYVLKKIEVEHPGKVRLIVRYMPGHSYSRFAMLALEEARERGQYSEALDKMFEKQALWTSYKNSSRRSVLDYLSEIGMDRSLFSEDVLEKKHGWKIDLDASDATKLGVWKTPTFFVNGKMVVSTGYDHLDRAVDGVLGIAHR